MASTFFEKHAKGVSDSKIEVVDIKAILFHIFFIKNKILSIFSEKREADFTLLMKIKLRLCVIYHIEDKMYRLDST